MLLKQHLELANIMMIGNTPKQNQGHLTELDICYSISLLIGEREKKMEKVYYDYIIHSESSYYYGVSEPLIQLSKDFFSKEASRYVRQ